ncbi:MAG: hypothetical protein LBT83_05355 [Tannerella sp.]|jgi:DNA integrity scanning protein DisA with diadenylate cyclase activity|nr:hypothetical protein [Tannerella sp.]
MKQLRFLLIIFLLATVHISMNAQTNDLSAEDIAAFKERTGQMIDRFQNNLSVLGSKDKTGAVKENYKEQTLKMFMGTGDPYKDTYGNEHPAVHMQVSSLRNGIETKRNILLKQYLANLVRLNYAKVEITQAETFRLSNVHKVGDHYEATALIFQKFCGYTGDGKRVYCDTTKKTIRIFIIPEEDITGKYWTIKFGDVDVSETSGI